MKYFHEIIGIIPEREVNLAKLFFIHKQKISFFGKIQKRRNDITKNLRNMAWDIFHIHNTINNINYPSSKNVDFVIPYFITLDKRLQEILPLYQIRSCAFVKSQFNSSFKLQINYSTDLIHPETKAVYFSTEKVIERVKRLEDLITNEKSLTKLIKQQIKIFEEKLK